MKTTDIIIAELVRVYDEAVATLRADVAAFAADGTLPPADRRTSQAWCYPELRVTYAGIETRPDLARAFGRLTRAGGYATTITRPALFADYLAEQIRLLA
jgi:AMP nucleosidase